MNGNTLEYIIGLLHQHKDTPLTELSHILQQYTGTEWKEHIKFSDTGYQRTKIYICSEFEIVIISWKKDQIAEIHDHPERGCLMKIVQGQLKETRYLKQNDQITKLCSNIRIVGNTGHICGSCGLHKIEALEDSVSIHIYSPPEYVPKFYKLDE